LRREAIGRGLKGIMKLALFVPCYIDQVAPSVAIATTRLLRRLGQEVVFPPDQTCCGQPAFNSGYWNEASELAVRQTRIFLDAGVDAVVCPSGSCAAMQKVFYPTLLKGSAHEKDVEALSAITHELGQFLVQVLGVTDVGARFPGKAVLHKSCHSLRELHSRTEVRQLLDCVRDLEMLELADDEECCGFGGAFSVKMPEISTAMGDVKVSSILKSGAEWVISGDSSCLLHIGGILQKRELKPRTIHFAEVLASGLV
jgi:L-lactate dehydrogenase complex protein LldE